MAHGNVRPRCAIDALGSGLPIEPSRVSKLSRRLEQRACQTRTWRAHSRAKSESHSVASWVPSRRASRRRSATSSRRRVASSSRSVSSTDPLAPEGDSSVRSRATEGGVVGASHSQPEGSVAIEAKTTSTAPRVMGERRGMPRGIAACVPDGVRERHEPRARSAIGCLVCACATGVRDGSHASAPFSRGVATTSAACVLLQ